MPDEEWAEKSRSREEPERIQDEVGRHCGDSDTEETGAQGMKV
jgi:hypothetical protein